MSKFFDTMTAYGYALREKEEKDNTILENKEREAICIICQRKFANFDKLKLHEKLSELHRQNLEKLKLNNN